MAEDTTPPVIDFEKLKNRPRTRVRAGSFVSIYSNSMNVEVAFNDFKLFFGEVLEATEESLTIEDRISVIMGPEEVFAVAKVLTEQIAKYEAFFGKIRRPPGTE